MSEAIEQAAENHEAMSDSGAAGVQQGAKDPAGSKGQSKKDAAKGADGYAAGAQNMSPAGGHAGTDEDIDALYGDEGAIKAIVYAQEMGGRGGAQYRYTKEGKLRYGAQDKTDYSYKDWKHALKLLKKMEAAQSSRVGDKGGETHELVGRDKTKGVSATVTDTKGATGESNREVKKTSSKSDEHGSETDTTVNKSGSNVTTHTKERVDADGVGTKHTAKRKDGRVVSQQHEGVSPEASEHSGKGKGKGHMPTVNVGGDLAAVGVQKSAEVAGFHADTVQVADGTALDADVSGLRAEAGANASVGANGAQANANVGLKLVDFNLKLKYEPPDWDLFGETMGSEAWVEVGGMVGAEAQAEVAATLKKLDKNKKPDSAEIQRAVKRAHAKKAAELGASADAFAGAQIHVGLGAAAKWKKHSVASYVKGNKLQAAATMILDAATVTPVGMPVLLIRQLVNLDAAMRSVLEGLMEFGSPGDVPLLQFDAAVEGSAGAGAQAAASVGLSGSMVKVDLGASATVGLGAGFSTSVGIDVVNGGMLGLITLGPLEKLARDEAEKAIQEIPKAGPKFLHHVREALAKHLGKGVGDVVFNVLGGDMLTAIIQLNGAEKWDKAQWMEWAIDTALSMPGVDPIVTLLKAGGEAAKAAWAKIKTVPGKIVEVLVALGSKTSELLKFLWDEAWHVWAAVLKAAKGSASAMRSLLDYVLAEGEDKLGKFYYYASDSIKVFNSFAWHALSMERMAPFLTGLVDVGGSISGFLYYIRYEAHAGISQLARLLNKAVSGSWGVAKKAAKWIYDHLGVSDLVDLLEYLRGSAYDLIYGLVY